MALKMNKKQPKGFTLVELMIVLVILGIVTVGAMTAIISQSRVYHSEEKIIDMQMNARVAMDRICFLLRMAGVGCEDNFGDNLTNGSLVTNGDVAANPLSSMFTITNNAPSTPDQLTLVGAVRHVGSITSIPANNQIKVDSHDPKLGTTVAKSYIFISPNDENRYEIISADDGTTLTLATSLDNDRKTEILNALSAGVDLDVYQVQAFTIRLVDTPINNRPPLRSLRIDGNIVGSSTQLDVADNIQDLQFQYGLDTDNDGQVDSWSDNPATIAQIKAVRVFILARTGKIDKEYFDRKTYTLAGVTVGPFTGTDPTDLNTYKHVHRYLLESTIVVRNRNL